MKKKTILTLFFALFISYVDAAGKVAHTKEKVDYQVIPLPLEVKLNPKKEAFILSGATSIVCLHSDSAMLRNARFLQQYIAETTHLQLGIGKQQKQSIVLCLDKRMESDEGYRISIDKKSVIITGKTAAGVFYGIQTLRKSLPLLSVPDTVLLPAVEIIDKPRFAYRGLLLDCARHFFSIEFIKKYIDLMALHHVNTFHWHLTDDQGWRIEIKKYPLLTQQGSKRRETVIGRNTHLYDGKPYGEGCFYTQEEIKAIVQYAQERFITIVPEIDMPGHMVAALACYPELGCRGEGYEVRTCWGISEDVLCIGNEKTYCFCQDIIDEVSNLFPGVYIHTGGDETPSLRWESCSKCQKLMKNNQLTSENMQGFFTNKIAEYIATKKKKMMGWDEIVEGNARQNIIVMAWRGLDIGIRAAQKGYKVILTPKMHTYFNYYQTEDRINQPLLHNRYLPIENVYLWNPIPDSLSQEESKRIIGIQGCLWSEYINANQVIEYQTLPRLAALSEVQWSVHKNNKISGLVERLVHMKKVYRLLKYQYYTNED